jgi:hypothetical protein
MRGFAGFFPHLQDFVPHKFLRFGFPLAGSQAKRLVHAPDA